MLKSVDRKQRNVKAASTVRVNAKMVFKRERKVFISLFHVEETWKWSCKHFIGQWLSTE